jgi:small subunit ribosomal protein S3
LGRKVHPIGFRLGTVENHRSRWFAEGKEYTEPRRRRSPQIRQIVLTNLPDAQISKVEVERFPPNQVRITVHSAKPGVIIGRKGATVNRCAMTCSRRPTSASSWILRRSSILSWTPAWWR